MKKPKYEQIYEALREQIVSGAVAYGAKLPSKRTMAQRFGVSVITAERALMLLEDEGYCVARQRRGYFADWRAQTIFPVGQQKSRAAPRTPRPAAAPPFPAGVYQKAVRRVLSEEAGQVLCKTENAGLPQLREAIARYLHRARGVVVTPEQILIGSGAEYLYTLVVFLLGTRRRYATETPCYEKIDKIYRLHGIRPQGLPMGSDGIRSEALAACRAQVLHLTPYHSFPSGITATAQKRAEYLRFAGEKNAILIEDDFGSEFHSARRPMQTLFEADGGEHVIYLNTFAKTVATGVRIGYMILPQKISRAQRERVSFLSCPVPTLSQFVMAQLLDSGDFERNLNRTIRAMQKEEKQNGEQ